jgi:DNA-binding GntR family transcriptional regulator
VATTAWQLDMAPHASMSERAYRRLKESIVRGHLPPGQRLREAELASQLSVSRSRVREALAKLEQEGLVVVSAFRGTWVSELTTRDIDEIYAARLLIEPPSARIVANRRDDDLLARLERDLARMRAAAISQDVFELTDADYDLHLNLVTGTGNRRIAEMAQRLLDFIWRTTPAIYANPEMPRVLVEEHARVVDAIKSGNGRLAEKTLRQHLILARANTLESVTVTQATRSVGERPQL